MISLNWLRDVCLDWFLIVAAIATACSVPVLIPVSIFVVGNRQHALALLGHEATHKLVAKSPRWNYVLGNVFCFGPIGLPFDVYRKFHMLHHKFLGTTLDPELTRKLRANITANKATRRNIVLQFTKDLLFLNVGDIRHFQLEKSERDKLWIGLSHLLIILSGFINIIIPIVWYLSMMSSLLACSRLRIWHEHVGTVKTHKIRASWWQKLLFLPHASAYHHEHHEKPGVPYNKLHTIASKDRKRVGEIH